MKKITFAFLIITLFSCKSLFLNLALKKTGAYDDKIIIDKIENDSTRVVLIPMVHIGTELLYDDLRKKIDSLKINGYYFYYELAKSSKNDDIILRKIRKVRGVPFSKKGYVGNIDSLFLKKIGKKPKKKLINQPTYVELGLNSSNSKNVDVTLKEMIDFYEKKYKEIKLLPCDFETSIYEKTTCDDFDDFKKWNNEVVIKYRNNIVLKEILKNKYNKIAVIYGKAHIPDIKKQLLNSKYKELK